MRKSISTTYIRQNLANKPLMNNAIAQFVVKVLFSSDDLDRETIYNKTKELISHSFSISKLDEVLIDLEGESKVKKANNKFSLRKTYRDEIIRMSDERTSLFEYALKTYFKNYSYPNETMKNWFDEMNIAFFTEYSSEWIEDLIGRSEKKKTYVSHFKTLHDKNIFKKNGIEYKDRDSLLENFISYLRSNDPHIGILMMNYANSLFAAKLIAANIFADKSIVDLFSNSKVILDTNVLLYLDLEKDKYSESYEVLERIFIKLNIKPVYLHITKEEYKRVIDFKIELMQSLITHYEKDVLCESSDTFIQTMLFRNCCEEEHFENYFGTLRELPVVFSKELEITEEDYMEIHEYTEGNKELKLVKQKMNEIYLRNHDHDKKDKSLQHDSELIIGTKYLQQREKAWILTRDGTVHTYSIENTIPGNLPIALNIDTIISLLSVNDGGVDLESSEFASIFAQFVMNNVEIARDAFKIEDLTKMTEIEAEISRLPSEQVIEIAREINHDRFIGIKESKIALKIQRKLQAYKIEIKDELSAAQIDLTNTRKENDTLIGKQEKTKNRFIETRTIKLEKQKLPELKREFIIKAMGQVLLILLVTALVIYVLKYSNESQNLIISSIIGAIINIITGYFSISKLWIPAYFKRKKLLIETIEKDVYKEWESINN